VDVQIEHPRLIPEEVVVQCRHIQSIVQERRHDRIYLILKEHQVAHHHIHAALTPRERDPSTETKWRWRFHIRNGYVDIIARNIDFQDVRLKVALPAEEREHLAIGSGYILGGRLVHRHGASYHEN
jgi:hypothetical protein